MIVRLVMIVGCLLSAYFNSCAMEHPYSYTVKRPTQRCSYCHVLSLFIPCTKCAEGAKEKALQKFGPIYRSHESSSAAAGHIQRGNSKLRSKHLKRAASSSVFEDVREHSHSGLDEIDIAKVLSMSAEQAILQSMKSRGSYQASDVSSLSILFADRAKLMELVIGKAPTIDMSDFHDVSLQETKAKQSDKPKHEDCTCCKVQ